MELRHLKYFLAVAEELNFSKAAEKLFISQPPLSRQIKELEVELDAKLFDRNNKRVLLTDAGKYFLEESKAILSALEMAKRQIKKISENVSGEFRIGYISSTYSATITQMIRQLSEQYPYVKFKLYEVPTAKQIAALESGKLDLGILRAPVVSHQLSTQLWFKDTYAIVYRKDQLNIQNDHDLMQLKDQTFVFFNKDYAPQYFASLLEICGDLGFVPNVIHESNNINSILQLVKNGLGVSIVPASLSQNYENDQLAFYPIRNARFFTEVMIAFQKNCATNLVKTALDLLATK